MFINRLKGFSLVELMVAMVVGLFVAGIVTTMYISVLRANSTTIQLARLNQDLQAALDIIARDIQRAGYVSGAEAALARNASGDAVNPTVVTKVANASFSAFKIVSGAIGSDSNDINATPSSPSGSCILIRYDANNDGNISGATADEVIGYKYNSSNKTIEFKSWSSTSTQACNASDWQVLAGDDGQIKIDALTFTIDPVSGASSSYLKRNILVSLNGASTKNPDLDITLERKVRLRNDQFIEK